MSGQLLCQAMGAFIMVASLLIFIFRPGTGQNSVKLWGFEGTLSTPSLAFLVLGALLFIFPMTPYYRPDATPPSSAEAGRVPVASVTGAPPPTALAPLAAAAPVAPDAGVRTGGAREPDAPAPADRGGAPAAARDPDMPPPMRPRYDMSGRYGSPGQAPVIVFQNGLAMTWTYDDGRFKHRFAGRYISPTEVEGIQTRTDTTNACVARMHLHVDASDRAELCAKSRLEPAGASQCDLPGTFAEQTCNAKLADD